MDNNIQMQELQTQVQKLRTELDSLSQSFFKNNFSSSQSFTKDVTFQTRLRVPVYSSAPTICEVGDICSINGQLFICTVANTTWTLVGTQT